MPIYITNTLCESYVYITDKKQTHFVKLTCKYHVSLNTIYNSVLLTYRFRGVLIKYFQMQYVTHTYAPNNHTPSTKSKQYICTQQVNYKYIK